MVRYPQAPFITAVIIGAAGRPGLGAWNGKVGANFLAILELILLTL